MLGNRVEGNLSILYVCVLKKRDNADHLFLPPHEFIEARVLQFLRSCPKNLIQLGKSYEYLIAAITYRIQTPIQVKIVFEENLELAVSSLSENKQVKVFCIDLQIMDIEKAVRLTDTLEPISFFFFYHSSEGHDKPSLSVYEEYLEKPMTVLSSSDLIEKIRENRERIEFLIPEIADLTLLPALGVEDMNKSSNFSATFNNYYVLNQLNNDCWVEDDDEVIENPDTVEVEKMTEESSTAIKYPNSFRRQLKLLDQVRVIDNLRFGLYEEAVVKMATPADEIFGPLILCFPYHNPGVSKVLQETLRANQNTIDKAESKSFAKLFLLEQSSNYVNPDVPSDLMSKLGSDVFLAVMRALKHKIGFIDDVLYLHASFTNSPVVRLPIVGKSINREVAFFKPSFFNQIIKKGQNSKLLGTISKLGQKLAERVSTEISDYISTRKGQIVAISDLPIEWFDVKGVPLCFTHDVCRIPETPLAGILSHYTNNGQVIMEIDEGIMNDVLIIYGCQDSMFLQWQKVVENLKGDLGFNTAVCHNVEDVRQSIDQYKPQILIFDCHGGVDQSNFSSYLLIGNEKLTNEKIISQNIVAPIVFLSACGTAPNYGFFNTIAQGFFEAGAITVTTTFLPIDINKGSALYVRFLNCLKYASENPVHTNWLSFMSYLVRSSSVFNFYKTNKFPKLSEEQLKDFLNTISLNLMVFENRRSIYLEMDKILGKYSDQNNDGFYNQVPEHLFYSHLGRADLIFFQSWKDKLREVNT